MRQENRQPWLDSAPIDSVFILLPAVIPLVIVLLFPSYFSQQTEVTSMWWIILVLFTDVAHVYSTLFRFYWEKQTFVQFKRHLILIPLIGLLAGIALHLAGAMLFWRVLAYAAVFHFVRQQYGFMRLYSRTEPYNKRNRIIDSLAIYSATLYPLLYWHMYKTNKINWFVKDDFIQLPQSIAPYVTGLYYLILATNVAKELHLVIKERRFNLPRNGIIAGTYLSWYGGIIVFNGDLIFTMMNVVAHGIPYMALVYIYARRKSTATVQVPWKKIMAFLLTIFLLAYFEESLWDIFVWKDHTDIFPFFAAIPELNSHVILSIVVPLLALPQITHYVVDGFIWRMSGSKAAGSDVITMS